MKVLVDWNDDGFLMERGEGSAPNLFPGRPFLPTNWCTKQDLNYPINYLEGVHAVPTTLGGEFYGTDCPFGVAVVNQYEDEEDDPDAYLAKEVYLGLRYFKPDQFMINSIINTNVADYNTGQYTGGVKWRQNLPGSPLGDQGLQHYDSDDEGFWMWTGSESESRWDGNEWFLTHDKQAGHDTWTEIGYDGVDWGGLPVSENTEYSFLFYMGNLRKLLGSDLRSSANSMKVEVWDDTNNLLFTNSAIPLAYSLDLDHLDPGAQPAYSNNTLWWMDTSFTTSAGATQVRIRIGNNAATISTDQHQVAIGGVLLVEGIDADDHTYYADGLPCPIFDEGQFDRILEPNTTYTISWYTRNKPGYHTATGAVGLSIQRIGGFTDTGFVELDYGGGDSYDGWHQTYRSFTTDDSAWGVYGYGNNTHLDDKMSSGFQITEGNFYQKYNGGGEVTEYQDVTKDVLELDWQLGNSDFDKAIGYEGTATIKLDNTGKLYSPENIDSPLHGRMTPNLKVSVSTSKKQWYQSQVTFAVDDMLTPPDIIAWLDASEGAIIFKGNSSSQHFTVGHKIIELSGNVAGDDISFETFGYSAQDNWLTQWKAAYMTSHERGSLDARKDNIFGLTWSVDNDEVRIVLDGAIAPLSGAGFEGSLGTWSSTSLDTVEFGYKWYGKSNWLLFIRGTVTEVVQDPFEYGVLDALYGEGNWLLYDMREVFLDDPNVSDLDTVFEENYGYDATYDPSNIPEVSQIEDAVVPLWTGWTDTYDVDAGRNKAITINCVQGQRRLREGEFGGQVYRDKTIDEVIPDLVEGSGSKFAPVGYRQSFVGEDAILGQNTVLMDTDSIFALKQEGLRVYDLVGDSWGKTLTAEKAIEELLEDEHAHMWLNRAGAFELYRYDSFAPTADKVVASFNVGADLLDSEYKYGQRPINQVEVVLKPKSETTNVEIWRTKNTIQVRNNQTVLVGMYFAFEGGETRTVTNVQDQNGEIDVTVYKSPRTLSSTSPIAYTAEAVGDKVSVEAVQSGEASYNLLITNTMGKTVYVDAVVYGDYIIGGEGETYVYSTEASGWNALHKVTHETDLLTTEEEASFYAEYILFRQGLPDGEFKYRADERADIRQCAALDRRAYGRGCLSCHYWRARNLLWYFMDSSLQSGSDWDRKGIRGR